MTRALALLLLSVFLPPARAAEPPPMLFGPPDTKLPAGAKFRLGRPTEYMTTALAFSADGKTLAAISNRGYVGGVDAPVELWNVETGAHVRTLRYHHTGVMAAAFAPDGSVLATSGIDNRLRFWDGKTGQDITTDEIGLSGHGYNLTFSPDGKRLLVGSTKLEMYDVRTQKPVKNEFFAETARNTFFHTATWSPKGKYVAAACDGSGLRVWDADTGNMLHTIDAKYTPNRTRFAFSADDRLLLVSTWPDGLFKVFDSETGKEQRAVKTPAGELAPEHLQFARATGRVAWIVHKGPTLTDRGVAVSDATGTELKRFDFPAGAVSLRLSDDGKRVAVGGADGSLRVYEAETGKLEHTMLGAWAPIFRAVYVAGGKVLRTVHTDGTVNDFDADTGAHRKDRTLPLDKSMFLIAVSADGARLASATESGALTVWDLDTGARRAKPEGKLHGYREMGVGGPRPVPLPLPGLPRPPPPPQPAPNDTAGRGPPAAAPPVLPQPGPPGGPRPPPPPFNPQPGPPQFFAAFAADGKLVAAVTGDSDSVTVWDTTTGEEEFALTVPKGTRALAFAPEGTHLYTGAGVPGTAPAAGENQGSATVEKVELKTGKVVRSWNVSGGEKRPNLQPTRTDIVALYPLADKETLVVVAGQGYRAWPPPPGPAGFSTGPRFLTVHTIDLTGREKDRTIDIGPGALGLALDGKGVGFVVTDASDPNKPATRVKVLDVATGTVKALTLAVGSPVTLAENMRGVTVRPGGADLAVRLGDGTVLVVNASKLMEVTDAKPDGKKE